MDKHIALILQAHLRPDGMVREPYCTASLQVWDGDEHLGTVDMLTRSKFQQPDLQPDAPLELYAIRMARYVLRMLEDNHFEQVRDNNLHYVADFDIIRGTTI